jgi:uncharacterized membrane-anchored protein YjiN (DUF445 family)
MLPTTGDPRQRDRRRMKQRASGLLLAATALFVALRLTSDGGGWRGYVEAGSEAAMVGGVADWFAVTALFRRPLGLPIPHTAIIPTRKDQIGRSLGVFVQEHFLNEDAVAERLGEFGATARVGAWMAVPANAERLAKQSSALLTGVGEVLRDDDVAGGLEHTVVERLQLVVLTPLVGRAVDVAIAGGHHQVGFDAALGGLDRMLEDNRTSLRERFARESPWWVPEAIDDRLFDKLMNGVLALLREVRADPDHELRELIDERVRELAIGLKNDPELIARGEILKTELLAHPEVRAWIHSIWSHVKASILAAADDPDSELRNRLEHALTVAGQRLRDDDGLRAKVDGWLESVARYAVSQGGDEVADLIATTVERWDATQTSDLIEAQVGRDLQFIRINGTVVGGLVGLVIHAVAQLL